MLHTGICGLQEEHVIVRTLLEQGLHRLHIRKPGWSEVAIEHYVERIGSYPDRLVLHGTPHLAARLGVKGVHYTEHTRPPPPLSSAAAVAAGSTTSTSFHSLQQLQTDWGPVLSYAFLSPVFDSISKTGYSAARFDRCELLQTLDQCPFPVIALGGITPENIQEAKDMGFAGAAVIGSIWQADDPVTAWERLQQAADAAWVHEQML